MVLKFNLTVHLFSSEVPFWQLRRWICFIFNAYKIGPITFTKKCFHIMRNKENGKFLTCNEINGILRRPFYSILDYLQVKALQEVWKSHLRQRTSSPSPTDSLGHFGYCSSLSLYRKKVPGSSSVLVLVILPLGPWSWTEQWPNSMY